MLKWIRKRLDRARDVCGFPPFQTGKSDYFHNACRLHDQAYVTKESTRRAADLRFYARVDRRIAEYSGKLKPLIWLQGNFYKLSVSVFGRIVW